MCVSDSLPHISRACLQCQCYVLHLSRFSFTLFSSEASQDNVLMRYCRGSCCTGDFRFNLSTYLLVNEILTFSGSWSISLLNMIRLLQAVKFGIGIPKSLNKENENWLLILVTRNLSTYTTLLICRIFSSSGSRL